MVNSDCLGRRVLLSGPMRRNSQRSACSGFIHQMCASFRRFRELSFDTYGHFFKNVVAEIINRNELGCGLF